MFLLEQQAERAFHPPQMGSCALQNPKYMSADRMGIGNQNPQQQENNEKKIKDQKVQHENERHWLNTSLFLKT